MGERKTQLSPRVSQEFRRDLEAFAARERRVPGTMACIMMEWAMEQLRTAGSIQRLADV